MSKRGLSAITMWELMNKRGLSAITAHELEDAVVDKFVNLIPDVGAASCK